MKRVSYFLKQNNTLEREYQKMNPALFGSSLIFSQKLSVKLIGTIGLPAFGTNLGIIIY